MIKKLNLVEKKLKFHCSNCSTTWQLLVIRMDLMSCKETKCLNNCLEKWRTLLVEHCQEQIILDLTRKEQVKDEKQQDLAKWLERIKKENAKK